ncbi:MAG: translation initiation factor IF-2 [Microscillaceae bacterium]|nr:translation initiation factor IF-2 [Microscillaceae bacterium]MDW8460779.1 translation initiation factor IF-2 [Cytophagales bacterium]
MSEEKMIRLSAAAKELSIGVDTISKKLIEMGINTEVSNSANAKITFLQFEQLSMALGVPISEEFRKSILQSSKKEESLPTTAAENSETLAITNTKVENDTSHTINNLPEAPKVNEQAPPPTLKSNSSEPERKIQGLKIVGKIDLDAHTKKSDKNKQTKKHTSESTNNQKEKNKFTPVPTPQPTSKNEPTSNVNTKGQKSKEKDSSTKQPTEISKTSEKLEEKEPVTLSTSAEAQSKLETQENDTPSKKGEPESEVIRSKEKEPERIETKVDTLKGLTVLGKIELPPIEKSRKSSSTSKPVASSDDNLDKRKKRRKKKRAEKVDIDASVAKSKVREITKSEIKALLKKDVEKIDIYENISNKQKSKFKKDNKSKSSASEISEKEIQEQIKKTLAEISGRKNTGKKVVKGNKRDNQANEEENTKLLKITEFTTANELASLMDVSVAQVISTCLSMGVTVSINQRLDAELITLIAAEFGYDVEFVNIEETEIDDEEENPEDLVERAPIVTIMGHVDHGKTSLLDYIRKTNVTAKEAGGITQHIGAYDVVRPDGRRIVFLDTPGHEAFTSMRARGAKITDIAIIVVAADDGVMTQTKEAINHARAAGVPIVIAINKIDKPTANPEKIKEELSKENILVESWGGRYQDELISAKQGIGIDSLLDKVLLEAELLELKANPKKRATGTVIDSSLDKGKGYVCNVLVQNGTLRVGDVVVAGSQYGKVRAMYDHKGNKIKEAPPSTPVQILGLSGAPQAGDRLKVMPSEREAKELAAKREQIQREQSIRATKGLTLDEIARRRSLGDFKELKLIIKADVDGSVEALTGSLLKLSTPEIAINVIHKGVGQITENDVQLAIAAKDTIIIGFQVRPSATSKKLAEQNRIQIKLYSVIYQAIEDVKDAINGMLAPKTEEVIVGNLEVREVFKISKVGMVAGCYVAEGYIKRNSSIRVIRDGIVILQEGTIGSLKRFKDDVSEVKQGYECGLNILNFNDLKIGDVIEVFEIKEVKRTL